MYFFCPCTFFLSIIIVFTSNPNLRLLFTFPQPYGHTRGEILVSLNYNPGFNTITVGIAKAKGLLHFDVHSIRGE